MAYLTIDEYKERSTFDPAEIDEFFARPGRSNTFARWEKTLRSRRLDDKLRARYAVPFGIIAPSTEPDPTLVPEACKDWLTAYLDDRLLRARRYPGDEQPTDDDLAGDAAEATREIEAAADNDRPAHAELPLRADTPSASGVTKSGPMVESFNTIHGWFDVQAAARDAGGW